MATPLSAENFLKALKAEGITVVEVGNWRTHNRNHMGAWGGVNGVMIHHTVTKGTARTVEICRDGYTDLPGPLCHGVIAKDGRVHLVGYGRANHAGGGDPKVLDQVIAESYGDRPTPPTKGNSNGVDGNARFYGFECENLGDNKDEWPAVQVEAIEKVSAALCRAHGWTSKSTIGHLEWSSDKIDPRGPGMPSMAALRTRITTRLGKPQPPKMPAFPGRQYFVLGAKNKHALQLQTWLHQGDWGPKYKVGPSETMTQMDLDKVKALQQHYVSQLGPADGLTGPLTWQYAFEVANGLRKK